MSARVIVGVILFSFVVSGLVLSNIFLLMMIGEINRERKDDKPILYFGSTFPKMLLIFREYKRSYPAGKLHIYSLVAFAIALVALIGVGLCVGIWTL